MTLHQTKLAVLILLLLGTGCIKKEKDELALPGKIMLKICIADYGDLENPLIGGTIGIKSIRFEGKRDAGADVFFETNPETAFPLLDLEHGGFISDFDIPRGVYNYMKMDVNLKRVRTNTLSDYYELDSLNTGLYFAGQYDYGYGEPDPPLPFIIVIDDTTRLSFISEVNQKFVLSDDEYGVTLLLDPFSVIQPIGQNVMQSLEPSGHVGHQIILISNRKNSDMHDYILNEIMRSARIIF